MVSPELDCTFCEALPEPKIPFEVNQPIGDGNASILSAKGMMLRGYMLTAANDHVTSFAQLDAAALQEIDRSLDEIEDDLAPRFGEYFRFESGSDNVAQCGGSGGCIDHAHQHLVPAANDVGSYILGIMPWVQLQGYEDIKEYAGEPYAYLGMAGSHFVVPRPGLPGQWMRRQLARVRDLEVWDWELDDYRQNFEQTHVVIAKKPGILQPLAKAALQFSRQTRRTPVTNQADCPYEMEWQEREGFSKIADACLEYVVEHPETAKSIRKFGAAEAGAYVMDLAEIDQARLRVHFYTNEGATEVTPADLFAHPIDTYRLGIPHNHEANIGGFIYKGNLIHHMFTKETAGAEYTEGTIGYIASDDPSEAHGLKRSIFIPGEPCGLRYVGSFAPRQDRAYWMSHKIIHTANWTEPTITVFFRDLNERYTHGNHSYYPEGADAATTEKPRSLTLDEQRQIWESLVELALSK